MNTLHGENYQTIKKLFVDLYSTNFKSYKRELQIKVAMPYRYIFQADSISANIFSNLRLKLLGSIISIADKINPAPNPCNALVLSERLLNTTFFKNH